MLSIFRNFLKSKIGMAVALIFLGVIALAFSGLDVSNSGAFGGVSGSDRVAIVGDERIGTSEVEVNVSRQVELQRQQNPGLSLAAFIANGGFEQVLDRMIESRALAEFGRSVGLRASTSLIDSRLARMPEFQNAAGNFDPNTYRSVLGRVGYTDEMMRRYLGEQLLQQQTMVPVALNSRMPQSLVRRYSALQKERRTGQIAAFPAVLFAPKAGPTDAQINAYYTAHRADYMLPERRVLRYAAFGENALKADVKPTEAEIKARYDRDIAQYRAAELRSLTTLIVPLASGETAARSIRQEVAAGKTLEAAARAHGLSVSKGEPMEQTAVATRDSAPVAAAAFATAKGQVSQPVRGRLGFYIVRVDAIDQKAGKSLDAARAEITEALTIEKRRAALLDLSEEIEGAVDDGSNLLEIADAYGLTIQSTPPLLANGAVYGQAGQGAPQALLPIVSTAFLMEEGQPQLDELVPGTTFLIYDVGTVTEAAPAPIADVKQVVAAAWRMEEGAKAAKAAADRVLKLVQQGKSMSEALAAEKVAVPPAEPIDMNRAQLSDMQRNGQSVPAYLALMFSMAKGSSKPLELGRSAGWMVIKLDDIEPGKLVENDPELERVGQGLNAVLANEQSVEFMKAVQAEVGVERNKATIDAVKARLSGQGG
jgi:peptidyl-prolyl cis-trans isomerase D